MPERKLVILDAPSNLGLRPPEEGAVPGCYKLPWALRDRGLLELLNARDGGSLVPPRYRSAWAPGQGDRNAEAIAVFSQALAGRVKALHQDGHQLLVLGGDCSILIGNMLALKQLGRYGLVFFDAHSDFRHQGNAPAIGAAAGEDLAIVTGRGDARLTNLEGLKPYVLDEDVHLAGMRDMDECRSELAALGICVSNSSAVIEADPSLPQFILDTVTRQTAGFWIHLDMDVVDSSQMSAVDSPERNGPTFEQIGSLLRPLLAHPKCAGMEVTIYDPDLDPSGTGAQQTVDCLVKAFAPAA
jgi:arginase